MKALVFRTDDTGVSWYRMRIPVGELARQKRVEIRTTPNMMPISFLARGPEAEQQKMMESARTLYAMLEKDVNVLHTQRVVHYEPFGLFSALSVKNGIPWIIDIDDNVLTLDRANPAYDTYRERSEAECYDKREITNVAQVSDIEFPYMDRDSGKLYAVKQKQVDIRSFSIEQLAIADALFVSTKDLQVLYGNMLRKRGKTPIIHILPNSIDFEVWDQVAKPPEHHGEIWVGWAGSASHASDVEILAPVMQEILSTHSNVRFFWTKLESPRLLALHAKFGDRAIMYDGWVRAEEWAEYYTAMNFDISLGPIDDTEFNRGKSNLKWLESAVLGQPFVCSDVGPYSESIRHKRDGFLCKRVSQWVAYIEALVESKQLRDDVGGEARRRCRDEFDIKKNCGLWAEAYEDVVKRTAAACEARKKSVLGGAA